MPFHTVSKGRIFRRRDLRLEVLLCGEERVFCCCSACGAILTQPTTEDMVEKLQELFDKHIELSPQTHKVSRIG